MSHSDQKEVDDILTIIATYICYHPIVSENAYETAKLCLIDSLGCAILALNFPECTKLLGPIVPGTIVPKGSRVPGMPYVVDPVLGAFNIGMMIRWLDYNDTWLAAEWGHPSDNLGGILAIGDFLDQNGYLITVKDILTALIKAYEIQGILSLQNSFNRIGFDHVILVRVATAGVVAELLGLSYEGVIDALSQAWIDGAALRTYRHEPSVGSRKSWAAGDATSRGVMLAMLTQQGERGYKQALSSHRWGFNDVILKGKSLILARPLGSYVVENILFKVSFPAEFHAQTAVECAINLYPQVKDKWESISSIEVTTHESAIRIIDKKGPLKNPADRDHCLQYMIAIGLLKGSLKAEDYEDESAKDPRIDLLRQKMRVSEDKSFSRDYLDENKRSIANSLKIYFNDGTETEKVVIEYPQGHCRRRKEALPLIFKKFESNLRTRFSITQVNALISTFQDIDNMPISKLMNHLILGQKNGISPL